MVSAVEKGIASKKAPTENNHRCASLPNCLNRLDSVVCVCLIIMYGKRRSKYVGLPVNMNINLMILQLKANNFMILVLYVETY